MRVTGTTGHSTCSMARNECSMCYNTECENLYVKVFNTLHSETWSNRKSSCESTECCIVRRK